MGDSTETDGTRFEKTISRTAAQAEDGHVVRLYRYDDDPLQRYEELCQALEAEAATLDPEQWVGGVFDVGEYVTECLLVGIYNTVEVIATVVIRGTGATVVEYFDSDADEAVAERLVVDG